jgi:hypothetical protein
MSCQWLPQNQGPAGTYWCRTGGHEVTRLEPELYAKGVQGTGKREVGQASAHDRSVRDDSHGRLETIELRPAAHCRLLRVVGGFGVAVHEPKSVRWPRGMEMIPSGGYTNSGQHVTAVSVADPKETSDEQAVVYPTGHQNPGE